MDVGEFYDGVKVKKDNVAVHFRGDRDRDYAHIGGGGTAVSGCSDQGWQQRGE